MSGSAWYDPAGRSGSEKNSTLTDHPVLHPHWKRKLWTAAVLASGASDSPQSPISLPESSALDTSPFRPTFTAGATVKTARRTGSATRPSTPRRGDREPRRPPAFTSRPKSSLEYVLAGLKLARSHWTEAWARSSRQEYKKWKTTSWNRRGTRIERQRREPTHS